MKILLTIAHMTIGGAQRVCHNLVNWLQTNTSAEVTLVIYNRLVVNGFKYDLSNIDNIYLDAKGIYGRIHALRKVIKQREPDVIVSFGTTNAMYDTPACVGLNSKHIVCERNDPAHYAGSLLSKVISRSLMRLADGYVFQTKDAQRFYGGNIAKHSVVIPNPLFNIDKMPVRDDGKVRDKTIVSVGRLNKQKNHPMLVRAFAEIAKKYPDFNLVIYGDGPERKKDEILIRQLGLSDKVELPGTKSNIFALIHNASLFVLSSDFEGMPNALMEAMALGLPCISTDCPCGGPQELIEDGVNGILIPVSGEVELKKAMSFVLQNKDAAEEMGQKAMTIRENYSLDIICQRWYSYFNQLANK